MSRRAAVVLLGVFGAGVFLAGLELMITAVALPAIILDFAPDPVFAFKELREASWIINGYLLVYVVAMPLAGRLSDLWGARRLFLGALVLFIAGSILAGRAQSLEELIGARLVQAAGGGILVPVGTAAASHLFEGHARPRALGFIGALTFLGMAAGPFLGAAILGDLHVDVALARAGVTEGPMVEALAPAWRWVFYLNVPIAIVALVLGWAASQGWDTPRRAGRVDLLGGVIFSVALVGLLVGLTLIGAGSRSGLGADPQIVVTVLFALAIVATVLTIVRGLRTQDPYLDPRLFRSSVFTSATLVSLLTGYGFATAIVGGAVFVDRVLYGGPDVQRVALGSLAAATALGALVSGFLVRVVSLRLVTLVGLGMATVALLGMSRWTAETPLPMVAATLALFGVGFGLTVTPRSTAAVEAVGRRAFGAASATVTLARMVGMAVGLAILTAYGSTTIEHLSDRVYATEDAYKQFIPIELRDRPLRDGLVVQALENWAAGEAATILAGVFLAAAAVTVVAVPPALAMRGHARVAEEEPPIGAALPRGAGGRAADGPDDIEPTLAL
jgi:EmrB/QacA subfamily drug resistance transporter